MHGHVTSISSSSAVLRKDAIIRTWWSYSSVTQLEEVSGPQGPQLRLSLVCLAANLCTFSACAMVIG